MVGESRCAGLELSQDSPRVPRLSGGFLMSWGPTGLAAECLSSERRGQEWTYLCSRLSLAVPSPLSCQVRLAPYTDLPPESVAGALWPSLSKCLHRITVYSAILFFPTVHVIAV